MSKSKIVIDTNVLVSAMRSSRGASYRLLMMIDRGRFEVNVSVPLVLEYEAAAKRFIGEIPLTGQDIDDIIDYICAVAHRRQVFYLWRPFSKDVKDDMVLELAVSAGCGFIVTFNKGDFKNVERFGLQAVTPREFLQTLEKGS